MSFAATPAVDPIDSVKPGIRDLGHMVAEMYLGKRWPSLLKDEKLTILRMLIDGAQPILVAEAVKAVRTIASIATDMQDEPFEMTPQELAAVQREMRAGTPQGKAIEAVRLLRP